LICHENRGLNEHFRDVARRLAKEGYVATAVDLLSREGGTSRIADPAQVPALISNVPDERHVSDFQAALRYYANQSTVRPGAYAMTGFCFGGGIAWRVATRAPELKAAVPWYGPSPRVQNVPDIKAAVFGIYASDDNFVNPGVPDLEAALKQANVTYQLKTYPNTRHGFNSDTGQIYNQEQALIAWKDMLDWFARYVKG